MNTKEKLLAVATMMVNEPEGITDVHPNDSEYYFRFSGFVFSMVRRTSPSSFGEYSIYMYPKWFGSIPELIDTESTVNPDEMHIVSFHVKEMPAESKTVFAQLYDMIDKKYQGVESILDNILSRSLN